MAGLNSVLRKFGGTDGQEAILVGTNEAGTSQSPEGGGSDACSELQRQAVSWSMRTPPPPRLWG